MEKVELTRSLIQLIMVGVMVGFIIGFILDIITLVKLEKVLKGLTDDIRLLKGQGYQPTKEPPGTGVPPREV